GGGKRGGSAAHGAGVDQAGVERDEASGGKCVGHATSVAAPPRTGLNVSAMLPRSPAGVAPPATSSSGVAPASLRQSRARWAWSAYPASAASRASEPPPPARPRKRRKRNTRRPVPPPHPPPPSNPPPRS